MKFTSAAAVEEVVWQMLLYEYDRALDRSFINRLFNGGPPLSGKEQEENQVATNVNDLSSTKIDHDARRQFDNAFVVPDPLWYVNVDLPSPHAREYGQKITKKLNKIVINSEPFLDLRQGVFASVVLHGVGPAMWQDRYKWCQYELGIEDVLVPGRTLRNLSNLPFLAIYRKYTGMELYRLTHGPRVDPGWQMDVVGSSLEWVDNEARTLMGNDWPEIWYPEKWEERFKENGGLFYGDAVPTIDTYDFYYFDDDGKRSGWRRRIILDAWGSPGIGGIASATKPTSRVRTDRYKFGTDKFLYDSGNRVYAPNLSEFIHFQFGDASAVAPFRYHSIRSLGFLLYAVCHLQNRLKCRFTDAVFESLMQFYRVANGTDVEKVQKIDLTDRGIVPEGATFVRPEERWKIDQNLVTEAMQLNRQTMADVSASFTQDLDLAGEEKERETATRTMAKVNSTAALVGSMLNRAYAYEKFRQMEISRRFCIPNSRDPDVKKFRVDCLSDDIPEEALNFQRWEIQPNRVVGGGNKMMQIAIAEKLMAVRQLHAPEAQTEILRFYDAMVTDDFNFANELNPREPMITNTIHDTELSFAGLISGNPVRPRSGPNPIEVVETMLHEIEFKVQQIMQSGGIGTPQDVKGLQAAQVYTEYYIDLLKRDKNENKRVAEYEKKLTALMNYVKAFAQRQQQMAQKMMQMRAQQNGMSPQDQAKLQFQQASSRLKLDQQAKSHAQRLAQRQLQFEYEHQRDDRSHALDLVHAGREHALTVHRGVLEHRAELAKTEAEAAANARMRSMQPESEG